MTNKQSTQLSSRRARSKFHYTFNFIGVRQLNKFQWQALFSAFLHEDFKRKKMIRPAIPTKVLGDVNIELYHKPEVINSQSKS